MRSRTTPRNLRGGQKKGIKANPPLQTPPAHPEAPPGTDAEPEGGRGSAGWWKNGWGAKSRKGGGPESRRHFGGGDLETPAMGGGGRAERDPKSFRLL